MDTRPSAPRIALVLPGDSEDAATASGTAHGLARALEELGVTVVRVHGHLPRAARIALTRAARLRWLAGGGSGGYTGFAIEPTATRNAIARLKLSGQRLDGIVQLASDFLIPDPPAPLVTYEDMTIHQAVAAGYEAWQLPPRDRRWRIARQARTYRTARACCTRSRWAADSIRYDYGVPAPKLKVVGVGRNRDPVPRERSWEVPVYLTVASDWRRKNGDRIVRAFAGVRADVPRAELHLVGRHPRIDAPGVVGHGFLSMRDPAQKAELTELYGRATCFVLPSLHEPLGISHAEAGAAGIPSIGTTEGGAREVIGPGGTVVDPHSVEAIAEAMRRFADPAVAAAAGRRAVEHAELFTWPRVAKRLLNALGLLDPRQDPEAEFLDGTGRPGA